MAKGYLHTITTPINGDVLVNGEYRGTGNIHIELEQGTYSISFRQVSGYITPSPLNVTVNPGFTALVTAEYSKA